MTEYNIDRILVPVDFSPASINALDTAVAMANRHSASILLLNVVETGGLDQSAADAVFTTENKNEKTQHAQLELQSLQHSITEKYLIPCEIIATTGMVAPSIVSISNGHQADMIVMGAHGESGFKEFVIGANAYNVVKNADCPVLTIPSKRKWDSFKQILFPVRPILSALEKYEVVRKIIRKNYAALRILGLANDCEEDIVMVKELASQLNEKLREDEVEAATYFKVGKNMAEEVLKIAALMETDLIVITNTINSTFQQLFGWPYSRHILNHAHFPVLSIKPSGVYDHPREMMADTQAALPGQIPLYN